MVRCPAYTGNLEDGCNKHVPVGSMKVQIRSYGVQERRLRPLGDGSNRAHRFTATSQPNKRRRRSMSTDEWDGLADDLDDLQRVIDEQLERLPAGVQRGT